ncbi:MAG: CRISPR-associated endoribonuclease Cas6 [Bacilli bacterium]
MKVYELSLKVFLLKDITFHESQSKISELIDQTLVKEEKFLDIHNKNMYKNYCFNSFYPLEKYGVYKAGNIYTVKIRTIDKDIGNYLNDKLANEYTNSIKGLTTEVYIIPKKFIEKIYTITPLIIKSNEGYWKNSLTFEGFEKRLKENLIKKYNCINDTKINEDFQLYTAIELNNRMPIACPYKGKKLLGDKVNLVIADDEMAQNLAYMSLGVALGEINARGYGFVNYKYL